MCIVHLSRFGPLFLWKQPQHVLLFRCMQEQLGLKVALSLPVTFTKCCHCHKPWPACAAQHVKRGEQSTSTMMWHKSAACLLRPNHVPYVCRNHGCLWRPGWPGCHRCAAVSFQRLHIMSLAEFDAGRMVLCAC